MSYRIGVAVLILALCGCPAESRERDYSTQTCRAGHVSCNCLSGDTCLQGLACIDGVCRASQGDPSTSGDAAAGDPHAGDAAAGDPATGDSAPPTGDASTGDSGPHSCGGIAGFECPEGQHCSYPDGICSVLDALGTCRVTPGVCPAVWEPVCGCDRMTYGNRCKAEKASVRIDKPGSCGPD
jgi:hypothetical protein